MPWLVPAPSSTAPAPTLHRSPRYPATRQPFTYRLLPSEPDRASFSLTFPHLAKILACQTVSEVLLKVTVNGSQPSPRFGAQPSRPRRKEPAQARFALGKPPSAFPVPFPSYLCLETSLGRISSMLFPGTEARLSSLQLSRSATAEQSRVRGDSLSLISQFYHTETFLPFPLHQAELLVSPLL